MRGRAIHSSSAKISPEEEERLFARYAAERSEFLRNQIAEAYLYIASIIAGKFSGRGVDYDDLFQVASLSLLKAVERFDASRDVKFASFAMPTMVGEVKNYFRDRSRLIRLPRKSSELLSALEKAKEELTQTLMRSPTAEELAGHTGFTVDEVLEALEMQGAIGFSSLDATLESDDASLHGLLGYQDAGYDRFEMKNQIEDMLGKLSETERAVVTGRFFDGLSQRDIAAKLGVSQMSVSRIERKALASMREYLGKH